MPTRLSEDKFLPFKLGDIVMVEPRDPNHAHRHSLSRVNFEKVYVITGFYVSIANLRCVYIESVDGVEKNVGVRLNRLTHTLRDPHWEV